MRSFKLLHSIVLALATVVATPLDAAAGAPVDDQAIADAAMAFFNGRMIAAGFVSDGPAGPDTMLVNEAALIDSDCMGATGLDLPDPGSLPGQTAFADSDEFNFELNTTNAGAHDDRPTVPSGEFIFALAIIVDEGNHADLNGYFDYLASEERAACIDDVVRERRESSASTPGVGLDVAVLETDLGVGERSALVEMHVSEGTSDLSFVLAAHLAVTGRTMVTLTHAFTPGGPFLDIDDRAELQRLVDSLSFAS